MNKITHRQAAIDSTMPGVFIKWNQTPQKICMEFWICTLICNNEMPVKIFKSKLEKMTLGKKSKNIERIGQEKSKS